jgi:integrase
MPRQKLTDAFLRGVNSPSEAQVEYWDTLTPGFGVRVSYGGRKAFVVLTRIGGKLHRFTLGAYPKKSLGEARDEAERIIKDAATGVSPKEREGEERRKAQANKRNTFRAVSEEFMADHAKTLRTREEMQRIINSDLLPTWGDKPIASITRGDAKALIREKARTAPIAANRLLSLISKIFSWALDEEIIQASPAVRLKRLGKEQERERCLTDDEIRKLWPTFTSLGYPFGHGMKFLLVTGQRRGEVAGMKWSEIDGEGWNIPGTRSKSGQGHRIPLSTLARQILEETPRLGEYVFISPRGPHPLDGWENAKRRVDTFLRQPIEPWRIHDLRRTMATHMRSLGIDRLVVSKLLNHAEGGITKTYDRYAADPEKAAAMERWSDRLKEIISGERSERVVLPHKKEPRQGSWNRASQDGRKLDLGRACDRD